MITNLVINLILLIVGALFVFFPVVTLNDIPIIGDALVTALTFMAQTWNGFIDTFPYAGVAWNVFLKVIIPFELLLITLKLFLGHRSPTNAN